MRMVTPQVDRRVEVPMNKVAFLEFVGLVINTSFVLEDEFQYGPYGCRISFNKID